MSAWALEEEEHRKAVEAFCQEIEKQAEERHGRRGVLTTTLMRIALASNPFVKKMIYDTIKDQWRFPGFSEHVGFWRLEELASLARWYARKHIHRRMVNSYSSNAHNIGIGDFESYIDHEVMELMIRLAENKTTANLHKTAFKVICTVGVILPFPGTNGCISVKDLLDSNLLDQIDEAVQCQSEEHDVEPLRWFSVQNVQLCLHDFRSISGGKSMVSYEDLLNYGQLNRVFLKGFWSSPRCPRFDAEDGTGDAKETDLYGFVYLQRLLFHISVHFNAPDLPHVNCTMEFQAVLQYLFRCLCAGWDDMSWSRQHFEHIVKGLHSEISKSEEDFKVDDIATTLLDFLSPADHNNITFEDIWRMDALLPNKSASRSTLFLGLLIDAKKFILYDRETM